MCWAVLEWSRSSANDSVDELLDGMYARRIHWSSGNTPNSCVGSRRTPLLRTWLLNSEKVWVVVWRWLGARRMRERTLEFMLDLGKMHEWTWENLYEDFGALCGWLCRFLGVTGTSSVVFLEKKPPLWEKKTLVLAKSEIQIWEKFQIRFLLSFGNHRFWLQNRSETTW